MTIERDGQKKDIRITPSEGVAGRCGLTATGLRGLAGDLGSWAIACRRSTSTSISTARGAPGRRLGVSVNELTDQLAQYFRR